VRKLEEKIVGCVRNKMLNTLTALLDRYKHIRPPDETVRICVVDFFKTECGADVDISNISVNRGIVYVNNVEAALKNELFIKKRLFLGELKRALGDKAPKDIR
jgi:hypothetical protein